MHGGDALGVGRTCTREVGWLKQIMGRDIGFLIIVVDGMKCNIELA